MEEELVEAASADHSSRLNIDSSGQQTIRAETRAKLVSAIAMPRLWLDELISGVADVERIAEREV